MANLSMISMDWIIPCELTIIPISPSRVLLLANLSKSLKADFAIISAENGFTWIFKHPGTLFHQSNPNLANCTGENSLCTSLWRGFYISLEGDFVGLD